MMIVKEIDIMESSTNISSSFYTAGFKLDSINILDKYYIEIAIWFPTKKKEKLYSYLPYISGFVSHDVHNLLGEFPLIVISSGYIGTMYDQSYLAESLARNGYVVMSVSHNANDKGVNLGCARAWYRGYEIKSAINYIYQSKFAKLIANDLTLIGFSAGGFSSLLLAGAVPDFSLDNSFSPYVKYLKNLDFTDLKDERVDRLCLFAPALGQIFSAKSLMQILHPILLITSENDEIIYDAPQYYAKYLPNIKINKVIRNAGHFVFNSVTSDLMKKLSPRNCIDIGIDREMVHPFVINETLSFLKSNVN